MATRRGLGKGLGALIPSSEDASSTGVESSSDRSDAGLSDRQAIVYAELPIDAIQPNPRQPRQVFDEEALEELTFSISEIGLLQPVVVRSRVAGGYELVAGERRLRASKMAGLTQIPALVRTTDDADLLRDALLENLHRSNLNPLEEAAAYEQMLMDFGCTQEELAARIGRSRPQVTNTLRLLKLPASVQTKVAAGVLSAGHARALLSLDDNDQREAMANRIIAEGLSVRTVEELVATDSGIRKKGKSRTPVTDTEVVVVAEELAARLAEIFSTRVRVSPVKNSTARGTLTVDFAGLEDLQRIVAVAEGN